MTACSMLVDRDKMSTWTTTHRLDGSKVAFCGGMHRVHWPRRE